jgi:rod shape-determining protein MreC
MPLGTLDRSPPPFFRQGPSALTKLVFFSALAVFLMVADRRLEVADPVRQGLAIALLPLQRAVQVPLDLLAGGTGYLQGLQEAQRSAAAATEKLAAQSVQVARAEVLARENDSLRSLLALGQAIGVRSIAAEVMYEAADPFSRKLFIDRGRTQGVVLGAPVVNQDGVLGQVTQLYALTSEVTLLIDKDAAIPVLNLRTQQRSAAFGVGTGMEMRFMSSNSDVQTGDVLHTSGLDGVYPPGLAVARVASVQRRVDSGFARITLETAAQADGVRHVLVLEPLALQLPPRTESPAQRAVAPAASRPGVERPRGTP